MKIKTNSVSLSQKAKEKIIEYIEIEGLQLDDKLPSEADFMEMLGVSRYTVREALALLEQDRVVYKIQGKGTFVNKGPIQIESGLEKLESVTEIIKNFGYEPGTEWVDIVEETPTQDMIDKLKISEDEKVITFKRIRKASGNFAAYCVDSLPKSKLNNTVPIGIGNQSMFTYLNERYNIEVEYGVSDIIPSFPTNEMMNLFKGNKNQLLLLLHQIHYDIEGNPVIYSKDYFNPEVFKFKVNRLK